MTTKHADQKIKALAKFLDVEPSEIAHACPHHRHDLTGSEFRVYTSREAIAEFDNLLKLAMEDCVDTITLECRGLGFVAKHVTIDWDGIYSDPECSRATAFYAIDGIEHEIYMDGELFFIYKLL